MMALSFGLGAVMFATTAFADIAAKTGYDQLKDAIKHTAESCSKELKSISMEGSVTLKDNDKVIISGSTTNKFDMEKGITESSANTERDGGIKSSSYSYRDDKVGIWYNSDSDTYYVNEYDSKIDFEAFSNPFKEERAKDVEKIFDALVGNLKEHVVVEEKADGSKEFSGSLSEGQIPALVNAVASFGFKQAFSGNKYGREQDFIPELADDVFINDQVANDAHAQPGKIPQYFGQLGR